MTFDKARSIRNKIVNNVTMTTRSTRNAQGDQFNNAEKKISKVIMCLFCKITLIVRCNFIFTKLTFLSFMLSFYLEMHYSETQNKNEERHHYLHHLKYFTDTLFINFSQ